MAYLHQYGQFTFSELTVYEIVRGYRAIGATKQLARFEQFCRLHRVLPVTWADLDKAANIWGQLKVVGQLIGEIDMLLAGTALHHQLAIVTHNVAHFSRISGLTVIDWTT
jgi:tRNA(fMet)-specific endonuclease VapC